MFLGQPFVKMYLFAIDMGEENSYSLEEQLAISKWQLAGGDGTWFLVFGTWRSVTTFCLPGLGLGLGLGHAWVTLGRRLGDAWITPGSPMVQMEQVLCLQQKV
ncbi:MAG TPA: hypothetical protein VFQ41_04340 [Candidatus Angelobacter sp.]|nr:hypothetical protein [Candidatus Angelobacter sp.]